MVESVPGTPKPPLQDVTNKVIERNGAAESVKSNDKQTQVIMTQKELIRDNNSIIKTISSDLNQIAISIDNLVNFMIDDAEKRRIAENLAAAKDKGTGTPGDGSGSQGMEKDNATGPGLGSMFGAAFLAYIFGVDKFIRTVQLPKTLKAIKTAFTPFGKLFTFTFPKTTKAVADTIKNIGIAIKETGIFKALQNLGKQITVPISNFITMVKNAFLGITKPVEQLRDTAGKFVKRTSKFTGIIGKGFRAFFDFFKSVGNFFKGIFAPVTKFLGTVGKIVGSKLLFPLFALFDFIKGFFDGFRKTADETRSFGQRILDGIGEGILQIIRGFLTIPLDLLKDGVAFIIGKLGFSATADAMKDFSFTELFNNIVSYFISKDGFIKDITDFFVEGYNDIKTFFANIGADAAQIFTNIKNSFMEEVVQPISNIGDTIKTKAMEIAEGIDNFIADVDQFLEPIRNFGKMVYDNTIKPVVDFVKGIFDSGGEGEEKDSESLVSKLFGGIDISSMLEGLPSIDNILGTVGERLNNAFQSIAEGIANSSFIPNAIGRFFSNAGVNIADFFGANNITRFNVDEGQSETLMSNGGVTEAGMAVGLTSREVAQGQATATSNYVSAPNVNAGNYSTNIQSETKISMQTAKPDAKLTRKELEAEGIVL